MTNGQLASRVFTLGRGKCPECADYTEPNATRRAPKLEPAGDSSKVCPSCGAVFRIGRVP